MNKLHIHERICTSCSKRVRKCVRCCHNTYLTYVHTCTLCSQHPTKMHAYSAKNANALVRADMQRCRRFFAMDVIANLSWVVCEHCWGCLLQHALLHVLLSRPNPSPVAVCSRTPSKSTLAQDAVAAAVLHKHHWIIRVGGWGLHYLQEPLRFK